MQDTIQNNLKTNHLGYLDGLRGVAALFVVFHHSYLQVVAQAPLMGVAKHLFAPLIFGRYAVDLFIVLSGFCLMLPIARGDGTLRGGAWRFFQRRAWRILPTYYLALLPSWALAATIVSQKTGTLWDISIPVNAKDVITHFLLLHDVLGDDFTINHAFWSIAVEWRIYFFFPALLLLWRRVGGLATAFLTLISSYALFFLTRHLDPHGLTAYYLGLFALGMLACSIVFSTSARAQKLRALPWPALFLALTMAVAMVSKLRFWDGHVAPYYLQDGVVGLWCMALLIYVTQTPRSWLHRWLNQPVLTWTGTFAYSLYLIHAPLLQVLWQYVFVPFQERPLAMLIALLAVGTPLIVAVSYGFFLLCERPFLRRKAKVAA